jgi:putative ABC transport system permease protein
MLQHYITIALRSLWKSKAFSAINVFGLAVGLAACLLILLYVWNELRYDRFHEKAARIVRVTMEYSLDGEVGKVAQTGTKVAVAFSHDFPEVEKAVRVINNKTVVKAGGQLFEEKNFYYADSTFFQIFSFQLLQGNPVKVLEAPNQVVLTEATARRYFGGADPVGKPLQINGSEFMVTGVAAGPPPYSHMKFDAVASFSSLDGDTKVIQWWSANYITYLQLQSPESIHSLQAKIPGYMKDQAGETGMTGKNYVTFHLEPLTNVHLYSGLAGFEPNGDITYIYIFSATALLILAIACVNYMNLATARATERAREVGVRKVMGALKGQLFGQFIGESVILTLLGMAVGLVLMIAMLPTFNRIAGQQLTFSLAGNPGAVLALLGLGLLVSMAAGSYPALVLANYQPLKVLKGDFKTSGSGIALRKVLIVLQFVISTFLIVATLIVQKQLHFIQNKKLGYDKDHIVVLPVDSKIAAVFSSFKSELGQNTDVKYVTRGYDNPAFIQGGYSLRTPEMPEGQSKMVTAVPVERDYLKTFNMQLVAGSDFTETDVQQAKLYAEEKEATLGLILNESAAKEIGWTPQEAIGKKADLSSRKGIIRGVISDFHFASMRKEIGPLVIFLENLWGGQMMVKVSGNNLPGTLQFIKSKWRTLAPHRPFTYTFLNDEFNILYSTEVRVGKLSGVFASLAIFLACLGLFGLAAFTTAQRTKEIGIRKVLGASVSGIAALLSKDFLKLVSIGFVIAVPLAWYAMHQWLQDFAYRMEVQWWIFALAGICAMGIALLTVSYHAIKTAYTNPVKTLRNE